MNIQEAQELLPFYVNGTLDPADREKIEALLKESTVLQNDLRFWQEASAATRVVSSYEKAGHPIGEQIVDYAQGRISDATTRLSVEKHIQRCDSCREEVELVRQSSPDPAIRQKTLAEKFWEFVGQYRLNYVVPVFAVAVLVIVIVNTQRDAVPGKTEEGTGVEQKPATLPDVVKEIVQPERSASFVLEYTTRMRSRERAGARIPVLPLDSGVTKIYLTLLIPHNQLNNVRYGFTLQRAGKKNVRLPKTYDVKKGEVVDSLSIEMSRNVFGSNGGKFEILVKEILPAEYADLTPEEYLYELEVKRK